MSETMETNPPPAPVPPQGPSSEASLAPAEPLAAVEMRRESPVWEVFYGPEGLYPGARWLIYLAMGTALLMFLGALLHFAHGLRTQPLWWRMANETSLLLAAILPGFVMARIEGRRFGDFGLPARAAFGRNFWAGALWGITALTILMLALRMIGVFSFGVVGLHGAHIVKFALYYAVFFLVTACFEEFLMRGYSQWVLAKGMNYWPAAALLSVGFGAIHAGNAGESKAGLVAVALIGFFWCLTLRRTGSLWWAVGFHMSWDWAESFLYSVPDSGAMVPGHLLNSSFHGPAWLTGGTVGPEGSYLIFVLLAALWVVFDRVYPEVKYREGRG